MARLLARPFSIEVTLIGPKLIWREKGWAPHLEDCLAL